ncbi:50S ribosomal protein L10 [Chrysiogenes arsenatis]|uniref:50S ribosomal protein L10 n=1 Tax=Chrysiogenes arsenatis TaxID=309797 RepID=UPI00041E0581|nr:50S ribosomal protein L10 [Chrysiogenes arsenatis]
MNQQVLEAKKQLVNELQTKVTEQSAVILCSYQKLTVAQVSEFRVELRKLGAEYKVIKNTMIRRAFSEAKGLDQYLHGTTGVIFVGSDLAAVAKYTTKFVKTSNEALNIKCGILDGNVLSASDIVKIADLPPREVLLARLLGSMNAPVTNFVGVLAAVPRKFLYLLNARKDQQGGAA